MRNLMLALIFVLMACGSLITSSPAQAKEVFHPFVKDQFYLAKGGTPATLDQVADDPLSVFRSKAAYDTFRAHVSSYLGRNLDDAAFRALLRSDRIRLVPCEGPIETAGVTDSGRIGKRVRACYRNEMNIELLLDDDLWVVVGSQACWNTVYGKIPYKPYSAVGIVFPPEPEKKQKRNYSVPGQMINVTSEYPRIENQQVFINNRCCC